MKAYDSAKPLLSLHVPKCAGQSFRRVLESWFGDKFFCHYFQQHRLPPPRHRLEPGICIHGHFNHMRGFGVSDYYPEADQFITVVRDPLDAAVSNYFFWKVKAREIQLKNGIIKAGGEHDYRDINDFFRKRPKSNMLDFLPASLTSTNYLAILAASFVWIGTAERLQESVDRLAETLAFPKVQVERMNASPRDEELSPALQKTFRCANALEFAIYHAAVQQIMNPRN